MGRSRPLLPEEVELRLYKMCSLGAATVPDSIDWLNQCCVGNSGLECVYYESQFRVIQRSNKWRSHVGNWWVQMFEDLGGLQS